MISKTRSKNAENCLKLHQWNKISLTGLFECPRIRNPCVSFTVEGIQFPISSPAPSFLLLSGVIRNGNPQYKGEGGGKILEQDQLIRLQKVQLESSRVRNHCVSFTVGGIQFPNSSPAPSFLLLSGVIRNGSTQYQGEGGGEILKQNQLNRLKMIQFECPRVRNHCVSFLEESNFPFPAHPLPSFCSLG